MPNQFFDDIACLRQCSDKLSKSLSKIEKFIADGDIPKAYAESYSMEAAAEKLTNIARLIPVATGNKSAFNKVADSISQITEISISYTEEGWFKISIPALLPRKEKGNASYIRASVQAALNRYFDQNPHDKFSSASVIIFEHIYAAVRKNRAYRDHDNIEVNVIVDLLAMYCMIDDSPMLCKHYYTSKLGENDKTNVYIVPASDFTEWLTRNEVMGSA